MGLVTAISHKPVNGRARHRKVECTYSVVTGDDGSKLLQLDTYGSEHRQIPGKKSQTLRFSPPALQELKRILAEHQL